MNLRERWEEQSANWIAWARTPGHDSYWTFHRDQFLSLLPTPGRLTIDIGCGEGRLTRHLKSLGHTVIGVDGAPTLVAAAREADPAMDVRLADAAALPLADESADLAVAFMSLQDVDAMPEAVLEIARVLEPGGCLCIAIVHPLNSAGTFEGRPATAPFVIDGTYLGEFVVSEPVERAGLALTFNGMHRPLSAYFQALESAGFLVDALREPAVPEAAVVSEADQRWQRVPLFLHLRARRPPQESNTRS